MRNGSTEHCDGCGDELTVTARKVRVSDRVYCMGCQEERTRLMEATLTEAPPAPASRLVRPTRGYSAAGRRWLAGEPI